MPFSNILKNVLDKIILKFFDLEAFFLNHPLILYLEHTLFFFFIICIHINLPKIPEFSDVMIIS